MLAPAIISSEMPPRPPAFAGPPRGGAPSKLLTHRPQVRHRLGRQHGQGALLRCACCDLPAALCVLHRAGPGWFLGWAASGFGVGAGCSTARGCVLLEREGRDNESVSGNMTNTPTGHLQLRNSKTHQDKSCCPRCPSRCGTLRGARLSRSAQGTVAM